MILLLDTHTMFWLLYEPDKLSVRVCALLSDPENHLLVSIGSLWELTIKIALGKMSIPDSNIKALLQALEDFGIELLPIASKHLLALQKLPRHHRDPFDRILIAQAQAENVPLLTTDAEIRKYDLDLVW